MNFGAFVKDVYRQENYFKVMVVFLLFLLLSFDQDLAMIYLLIMIGDYIWFKSDNFISFPISKGRENSIMVYVESVAALGIFLVVSTLLVSTFDPQAIAGGSIVEQTQSIFHLLATSTPILKGSKILTIIGWGVLIPIIETQFFNGRLLEGLATYAENIYGQKIPVNKFSSKLFMVMIVVAALFTIFHITAKGLASIPLLITFIFSIISSILVVRHQETKGAIFMHIITNTMAVLSSFGYV